MKKSNSTKRRNREATRARLMNVAREVFSRDGYDGARSDSLAARAGVNKAMINYYYGGKLGLYRELIVQDMIRLQERLAEGVSESLPPDRKLARLIQVLCDGFRENPALLSILVREQMAGSPNLEPRVWRTLLNFYQAVRKVLEEGQQRGTFRAVDAHATHLSLIGGLVFYMLTEPARRTYARAGDLPPTPDWDTYVNHTTELFLRGLSNAPGPRRRNKK